jgi:uncharacterized cupredoxin-like copper-binding protein
MVSLGRSRAIRGPACLLAVFASAFVTACGGDSRPVPTGRVIGINERDFHISVDTVAVAAGDYVLRVHNAGPDQHELIVVADRTGGLPMRGDGFTANEESIASSEPGALDPQHPGATTYLRVHLKPGHYVLFCNMAGHFMAGMRTELVVG